MVKALVVEPEGNARVVETPGQLDDLRELLGGGWLEGINGPDWHAYVDEEGGMKGMPFNPVGTALARALGSLVGSLVGPVIFLGTAPGGEEGDCPSHILERVGL